MPPGPLPEVGFQGFPQANIVPFKGPTQRPIQQSAALHEIRLGPHEDQFSQKQVTLGFDEFPGRSPSHVKSSLLSLQAFLGGEQPGFTGSKAGLIHLDPAQGVADLQENQLGEVFLIQDGPVSPWSMSSRM